MTASNPLLQDFDLPPYSQIKPEHVEPAIDTILADSRAAIAELLAKQPAAPSWESLVQPLDELGARLGRAWSPVSHLNAVCNNAELRAAYEACLPKLSEYWTELGQNKALFEAYEHLAASPAAQGFEVAQRTILDHALRDFRLSGIDLPADQQKRYGEIQMKLSELTNRMPIGRLYCTNDTVWASVPVFGRDFQSTHLMLAVEVMTGLADELDDRLHGEFGGKRFFGEDKAIGSGGDEHTGMYL